MPKMSKSISKPVQSLDLFKMFSLKKEGAILKGRVQFYTTEDAEMKEVEIVFQDISTDTIKRCSKSVAERISQCATEFIAQTGDTMFVSEEDGKIAVSLKQANKKFSPGTVGHSILVFADFIGKNSDYKTRDIIDLCLTKKEENRNTQTFIGAVCGKMCRALKSENLIVMRNIPKPHRHSGNCYRNAWEEFRSTGNMPIIALEAVLFKNGLSHIVAHALNYDHINHYYYDTTTDTKLHLEERMGWIIKQGSELLDWYEGWNEDWTKVEHFSETYGGYEMLWIDDKLLTVHTKGIDCPRIKSQKEQLTLEIDDLAEVSRYGWSVSAKKALDGKPVNDLD